MTWKPPILCKYSSYNKTMARSYVCFPHFFCRFWTRLHQYGTQRCMHTC